MRVKNNRIIFHIDMDAFFASIEQHDHPSYKGKPVIVGAMPGSRGVVAAASYEARTFGIHSAMPINEAFGRCPKGIFVHPRGERYAEVSHEIMTILEDFSPRIEQVSVDEAFLDMTGTEKLFGTPRQSARKMKNLIQSRQHLTASVGIAPNKFLAKIASDLDKPNGITLAPFDPEKIIAWLGPMPVGRMWGVGTKSRIVFERMGVMTIADLQKLSLELLHDRFGKQGAALYWLARGIDEREVAPGEDIKSISREHTFNVDSRNKDEWKATILVLAQDVARRARRHGVKGSTVYITWRRSDFSRHSRRQALPQPTNIAKLIYESAIALLAQISEPALRLIGVGISGFAPSLQTDLFGEDHSVRAWEASEQAIDRLSDKFGARVIAKGTELHARKNRTKRTANE